MGPSSGGSKAVVVRRWIKRVVVGLKAASHVPVTAQEAIERRAKRVDFDAPNRVRKFQFKSYLLSVSIFHRLVKECPNLNEITLGGYSFSLLPDTWIILSAHCPHLRILRIQECDKLEPLPRVLTFVRKFLRPEELELNTVMFKEDPDDLHDGLEGALRKHEENVGSRHPLKVFCLSGSLRRLVRVLADLLALPLILSNIVSLKVGGIDIPYSIDEREPASERLSTSARVPKCRLPELSVSVCHIRDLIKKGVNRVFGLNSNDPERREIKYRREVWSDIAMRF
ncbi:hypothetical protein K457DRAFT_20895 [Linnemannia elongata AG-77]|uniref:F-box domain-containing protein n=1 Tax=Linnemannia elongata AG-77 TaxID=1314771 RepID=A0A197JSF3_9FUNG|nr:hypothetical protein K457DRAFT_20895 [Linnemannia elongata AG-77]